MVLNLVLVESAVELVPKDLRAHPSVRAWAVRRGRSAETILLERSYHHAAMVKEGLITGRRGRPDIAYLCILEALGTPLSREGQLRFFLHTFQDMIAEIPASTRVPRSYERFRGLLEQLLVEGRVPTSGNPLITIMKKSLRELKEEIRPDLTVALTTRGNPMSAESIAKEATGYRNPAFIVGGFAQGNFSEETVQLADSLIRIDRETLDSQIVVARLVYEYEKALGMSEKRL